MYRTFFDVNLDFFESYFGTRENLFTEPESAVVQSAPDVSLRIAEVADMLASVVSCPRAVVLRPSEINALIEVATPLARGNDAEANLAETLLQVAQRGRPEGPRITKLLKNLAARKPQKEKS